MATRDEWQRLINLEHELALIERDLRTVRNITTDKGKYELASDLLWEHFGVDTLSESQ